MTDADVSTSYYDLGTFSRPINTTSPVAQTWFNRGLTWTYGFNHEEAIKCFEYALVHDPACLMAFWGIAFSLGPNYNKQWAYFAEGEVEGNMKRIHQTLEKAGRHITTRSSPVENALVKALYARYPSECQGYDFMRWNEEFAEAMRSVYEEFPDDLDVAALYVESLMDLTPWKLWDIRTGEPLPGSRAVDARRVLEKAFKNEKANDHPGLLHLYIHLTEMSTEPERAIPAADRLFGLVPDAGHLNHMPSHLDILIGDYRRAIASNAKAISNDEVHLAQVGPDNFYTVYRLHDFESIIYAAMLNGQYDVAIRYAHVLDASISEDMVRRLGDFVESSVAVSAHVMVRFGKWEDILAMKMDYDPDLYSVTTATLHYARGIAFAATGDVDRAKKEQKELSRALERIPPTRLIFPNKAEDVMQVGFAMLDGEIAYREGDFDSAFKHLRKSIEQYDSLIYGEPWSWMQPVRHAYAALQLERGNVQEALNTYGADLGYDDSLARAHQHPNNVWALHGYHECLVRLGQHAMANIIKPQLRLALAVADVKVSSSCFCRLETMGNGVLADADAKCCD